MKKISIFLVAAIISMAAIFSSFITANDSINTISDPANEFEILLSYIETNNNFINSDLQLIIPADEVKQNMKNPKYHIIDIRSDSWFEFGHVKNANNVKATDLLSYFETKITPADYEKIVMVCYSGQSAAYFSSLLRLAGYDNVYSMKWGMSSWREDFAENSWMKNAKNTFADKLETSVNPKAEVGNHPALTTGLTDAKEILRERLEKAFATPYKEYIIKSADVFEDPSDYYVVNYWDLEKYNFGHIPGAVQYEPGTSLASTADLFTLPTDKKIAVYCCAGQHAAHTVAYLNLLGYDVANIAYGANSFMNKPLQENDWNAFSKKEINLFPVIE